MKRFSLWRGKLLLLVAAVFLSLTFTAMPCRAAGSSLYDCSVSSYMVNADPGEDPHLKIEPSINEYYLTACENTSGQPVSSGSSRDMLLDRGSNGTVMAGRHSSVNLNLWMIKSMIFWTLTR